MLSKYVWENIAQENYLCNVDPERSDTLWQENDLYNVVLICLYQHWTRKLPVQCWSKAQEQLCNFVWANIAQGNHLCNVCPWLTDNFYEENNLYNVASTMLRQYYIGILSVQCCPNTSERILHKKIICAVLTQSAQTRFGRKMTYTMLSWSACTNIEHENCLCNVDPKPKNNFATLSGPTLHREITYVMFAHG